MIEGPSLVAYYGDIVKDKVVHKHNDFLKKMYAPHKNMRTYSPIDWFNLSNICEKWIFRENVFNTFNLSPPRCRLNSFFNGFVTDIQYIDNENEITSNEELITKCDVIFWTMNQHDMYSGNCIDNDSNNVIELIYHVPKHLARDTPGQDGFHKVSCFIQGCIATTIASSVNKMPLYTKFNPILQQQEYNKNYISEYIKPKYSSDGAALTRWPDLV